VPSDALTTTTGSISTGLLLTLILVYVVVVVFYIAVMWKVFTKAGHPGWAAIIPIYNTYILCKIAGRPGWWVLLFLIPVVNIVVLIMLCLDVAQAFGKSGAFGFFGLFLFSFIGFPILAFGSAQYRGGNGTGYGPPGYQQPGYPPMQGYPPAPGSYPQQGQGYPQQNQGYPPGYPQQGQQGGYAPPPPGY